MGSGFGVCPNESTQASPEEEEVVTAPPPPKAQAQTSEATWAKLGGEEVELALRDGLVKCLDSKYLVELSRRGEPLARRQDMPDEAYLGIEQLKELGVYSEPFPEGADTVWYKWLPVMIVSYAWLSPDCPDPFGETLGVLAKALSNMKQHGVIIDFTALPQVPRSEADNQTFELGVPCLSRLYSHPHVVVLKVSQFPEGYPLSKPYNLPEGYEPVEYSGRGWCFAEAAMAGLGKSPKLVCDVSTLSPGKHVVGGNVVLPQPPMTPENFDTELRTKTFTQPNSDIARVQDLYRNAFSERVRTATSLLYANLAWGPAQIATFTEAVMPNATAETMDLSHNEIGAKGMKALAQVLYTHPALKTLRLVGCALGDDGALEIGEGLKLNQIIATMDLRENEIGDVGARGIGEGLKLNKVLTTLHLGGRAAAKKAIGDEGAEGIAEGLKLNEFLTTLNLEWNRIGNEGAQKIGEALKFHQTLMMLDLQCNLIGDVGAQSIGEGLKFHQALTTLKLNCNQIGDEGAQGIAEGLKLNQALTTLELYKNNIGAAGAQGIGEGLKVNQALTKLYLGCNKIGDAGAHGIGEGLKLNQALTTLYLRGNNLGDTGTQGIVEGLKLNQALTTLHLGGNNIGDVGAQGIGEGLKLNQSLTELDLRFNKIGDVGAQDLGEGLKLNHVLTSLYLGGNKLVGAKDIGEGLRLNPALTKLEISPRQRRIMAWYARGEEEAAKRVCKVDY